MTKSENLGMNGFDVELENMVQAKKRTNKLETLFATAKAWLARVTDTLFAGLRPVSALAVA